MSDFAVWSLVISLILKDRGTTMKTCPHSYCTPVLCHQKQVKAQADKIICMVLILTAQEAIWSRSQPLQLTNSFGCLYSRRPVPCAEWKKTAHGLRHLCDGYLITANTLMRWNILSIAMENMGALFTVGQRMNFLYPERRERTPKKILKTFLIPCLRSDMQWNFSGGFNVCFE